MQIRVQSLSFRLTDAIRQHVEGRIGPALAITGTGESGHAVVRLCDLNGPKGGIDKSCRVMVLLRAVGAVVVEAVDSDLYQAVDRAAVKLRSVVARRYRRHRDVGRQLARELRRNERLEWT
jgi:putative sigma-54 modulation protein